jgi:hypothetical protein
MKKTLIVILLGFTQFAMAQVRVNLDNLYTVTFPLNPTKTKTDANTTVYSANQNDGFYIVMVQHMPKQFDYTSNADSLQRFYKNLLNSTIKKASAKLVYQESLKIDGTNAIDFGYTLDDKAGFPDTRFQRSVYINKTLISFSFWTFKAKLKAVTADKEIYFNTITTPKEEAPPAPYTASVKTSVADSGTAPAQQAASSANKTQVSYPVGYIVGAVIFVLLLIAVIVFNKKSSSKNKK